MLRVDGSVSTFLESKGYGFIAGDDGRSYFVHRSELKEADSLHEGQRVSFSEHAGPKGYRARKVVLLSTQTECKIRLPESTMATKLSSIQGWEVFIESNWKICAGVRGNPNDARALIKSRAERLGYNGVINVAYSKETGVESGTGRGTHYFTIHRLEGTPVLFGRRSTSGTLSENALPDLDSAAQRLNDELLAMTASSRSSAKIVALGVFGVGCFAASLSTVGVMISSAAAIICYTAISNDYGSWLRKVR